jgi:hypothetical protein
LQCLDHLCALCPWHFANMVVFGRELLQKKTFLYPL